MKFKSANRRSRAAERSADFQSAVSPNCIRLGVRCSVAGGLQIRDSADYKSALRRGSDGFTLAEVLAALLFMAIVIPVAVQGLRIASRAGSVSERKAVAARLAENKLIELVVTGQWQSAAQKGTIQEGFQSYSWQLQSEPWAEDGAMRLVTVHVNVPVQGRDYDVHVSTLVDATQ
jgi:type II secretion system protein I